jgi:hypothetical protein
MLKEGNDHFEATRLEPKVDVCDKRDVFNAEVPVDATWARQVSFNPMGNCPAYHVRRQIAAPLRRNKGRTIQTAELIAQGTPTVPARTGTDGGTHPVFLAKTSYVEAYSSEETGASPSPSQESWSFGSLFGLNAGNV